VRVVIGGPQRSGGGIPWWLIVGGLGFLVFGGWKGFFGAIAGVILIPVALLTLFALGFFVWSIYLAKKYGKGYRQPSPFEFERRQEENPNRHQASASTVVIDTEATVVKSEDER